MKKIFITVLTLGALVANAQDSTQKKIQQYITQNNIISIVKSGFKGISVQI